MVDQASGSTSYAIIGGGIIGLALAYRLVRRLPGVKVTVFEKEAEVGKHQSGHNSGVLHAGLYYKPGSLKAKLAVSGIRQMRAFCERHGIAHDICGKLVVACSQEEIPRLRDLYDRGQRNGLRGLAWLNPDEMREIEPHVAGVAALHVPEEGIADYPAVCRKLQELVVAAGGEVLTGTPVTELRCTRGGWAVNGRESQFLINAAGLHCDRVLALSGLKRGARIVPFRGEYYQLSEEGRRLVRNLIYPVPDPRFPFLGVHFTRMIHGGVEAGPNAVLATAREGYRYADFSLRDVVDTFGYAGFWRFIARYPSMTFFELKRSLSRSEFCRSLQRLVPALEERHLAPGGAGVRAQALAPDGTLLQDFEIVWADNALHLINAPSPGATASLAIADYLIDHIAERRVRDAPSVSEAPLGAIG
jgi:L-2-hydroxyglutarate oxidase LhgO